MDAGVAIGHTGRGNTTLPFGLDADARSNDVIELRLPWLLLNVADPVSRTALGDLWEGGVDTFEQFDRVSVSAGTYRPNSDGTATDVPGETNFTHAVPGIDGRRLRAGRYTWELWNEPGYTERRKESYRVVQRKFSQYR